MILRLFRTKFIRLVLIGAIASAVDYLLLRTTVSLGVSVFWSASLGYALGNFIVYVLGNFFVFGKPKNSKAFAVELMSFLIVAFFGLIVNNLIIVLLFEFLKFDLLIAKAIAVVTVFVFNYFGRNQVIKLLRK